MLLRIVQRETQFSFGMNQLSIKFRRFRYRTKSVPYQLVDSITNRTCDVAVEDNKMMITIMGPYRLMSLLTDCCWLGPLTRIARPLTRIVFYNCKQAVELLFIGRPIVWFLLHPLALGCGLSVLHPPIKRLLRPPRFNCVEQTGFTTW